MGTNLHKIMGIIGGIVCFAAFFPYVISILRGKTKPNRASWVIWAVVGILLAKTYYEAGGRYNLPGALAGAIGPVAIAFVSFKYGEGGANKFDALCLFGALVSVILWKWFHSPVLGLCGAMVTDFMGVLPTWRHLHKNPRQEEPLGWIMFSIGNMFNMFTIERITIQDALYPTYFLVGTGISTYLVLRGRSITQET